MRMIENGVLRNVLWAKREGITEDRRKCIMRNFVVS
jgi:hypothetical protein